MRGAHPHCCLPERSAFLLCAERFSVSGQIGHPKRGVVLESIGHLGPARLPQTQLGRTADDNQRNKENPSFRTNPLIAQD